MSVDPEQDVADSVDAGVFFEAGQAHFEDQLARLGRIHNETKAWLTFNGLLPVGGALLPSSGMVLELDGEVGNRRIRNRLLPLDLGCVAGGSEIAGSGLRGLAPTGHGFATLCALGADTSAYYWDLSLSAPLRSKSW